MENLTVHLKVVGREIAGIQHLPGWHTILLKQEKTGRTFKQHVQPGEKPERGWREKVRGDSDYISVPVTDDNHLRHEFHAAVDHVSPGHAFDALFVLDFSVASQEAVALRWPDDPVRKVELEIRRVLNGVTSSADWRELYDEIKLDGAVDHFGSAVLRAQTDLQPFANSYGINIDRIRMRLRLSKTDAEPDEKEAGLDRSRRITRVEKEEKIDKSLAGHTVNVLEAQHAAELRTIESWGKLRANAAAHVDKALGNIADNTNSGDVLARNVQVIQSLAISGGTGGAGTGPTPGFPGTSYQVGQAGAMLIGAGGENKLITTATLIGTTVDSLTGDRPRKRQLASHLLHLAAETWLEKGGSEELKAKHAEAAKKLIAEYSLTSEQFEPLSKLSDLQALENMLK